MVKMYVCPACGYKSFNGFQTTYTSNKIREVFNIQTNKYEYTDIDYEEYVECECLHCGKRSYDHPDDFIQDVEE